MGDALGSVGVSLRSPNHGVPASDHHDRIQDIEPRSVAPDYPACTVIRAGRAYGPDRLIYGGGYGAEATGASYRAVRERLLSYLGHLSAEDQAKVGFDRWLM
jgi:hypothetical protein